MRYISTRGKSPKLNFDQVVLTGLATDSGLYLPENWPCLNKREILDFQNCSYSEIVYRTVLPFIGDSIPKKIFKKIINKSYKKFRHEEIAPLFEIEKDLWMMELFHGPSLAFKDFALQLLGGIFDYLLKKNSERITILGATSGDTGSAAIEACKDKDMMDIFILHPHKRITKIQRKQMTTVDSPNVFNIAIKGSFDDCQDLVKKLFSDTDLGRQKKLSSINSINWARIIGQIPYYFYATAKLNLLDRGISFCVPSGNFGNAYACYVSKIIGLPVRKIIIGSNRNDVLTRFFTGGSLKLSNVVATLSPSMDIQISSNLERYLFEIFNRSGSKTAKNLESLRMNGRIDISKNNLLKVKKTFEAYKLDDNGTLKNIKKVYNDTGKIIDPHSSVGFYSAMEAGKKSSVPIVTLATAHPSKFPQAVRTAIKIKAKLPRNISDSLERKEKYDILPNDFDLVKNYISTKSSFGG